MFKKLISVIFLTAFMTNCGIQVKTSKKKTGHYATYEVYKYNASLDEEYRVDEGCIYLDTNYANSIATIYKDRSYGETLAFEYSIRDDEISFALTNNGSTLDERLTNKYSFTDGQTKVISARMGEAKYIVDISGPGCVY